MTSEARQVARQIRLFLEDGQREHLIVALALLDNGEPQPHRARPNPHTHPSGLVMVCSECGHESCAKGELMCEDARTASLVRLEELSPEAKVRRLRAALQSLAEDYQQCDAENRDLRIENARLKGQVDALREHWDQIPRSSEELDR